MSLRTSPKHWLVSILLVLLTALGATPSSVGADDWCEADPIIRLNGTTNVQILVSIQAKYLPLVYGPTQVEIRTPPKITREVLYTDAGFNNFGETVIFGNLPLYGMDETQTSAEYTADGRYRIWINVAVPVNSKVDVPIRVRVIPDGGKELIVQGPHTGTATYLWVNR